MATIPSQVGASHTPRRWWRRSAWVSLPSGSTSSRRCPRTRRSRGGSSRPAASTRTGSASTVMWSGRPWVPWVSTLAWVAEIVPSVRARAVAARGPPNRARAVRTELAAAPAPRRSRACSQAAVEPSCWSCSAPGGAAGVHGGEFSEPLAFQAVHQPPQDQDPLGPNRVGQPVQVLGGQPVHGHRQRRQPVRCSERRAGRICVRVHGGNLSAPHRNTSTHADAVEGVSRGAWPGGSRVGPTGPGARPG